MLNKALALVSTVLLLMSLGFSVLGTTPLLVLKHLQPMDARVIRQVFHYCYRMVALLALAACLGNALEDRMALSVYTGFIALWVLVLHRWMLARMDALRTLMQAGASDAVRRFRFVHALGVLMNMALFALAIGAISQITL
jgi:hypothetical protein